MALPSAAICASVWTQAVSGAVAASTLAQRQTAVTNAVSLFMVLLLSVRYFVVAASTSAAVGALPLDMMAFDAATVPAGELES